MALVCDGLAANRKVFRLHKPVTTPTEIIYKVKNPYADDGWDLYFIYDPPRLIKCKLTFYCSAKERRYAGATLSSYTTIIVLNKHLE